MGWPERLDAMQRQLDAAVRAVQADALGVDEDLPGADGPIPPHLVERAVTILAATRQAEAATEEALTRVGHRLTRLRTSLHAAGDLAEDPLPAYVDTRA